MRIYLKPQAMVLEQIYAAHRDKHGGKVTAINSDYFRSLNVALGKGRNFVEGDRMGGPAAAIANEEFAPTPTVCATAWLSWRRRRVMNPSNAAFYCLEPQAADGFVGSGVFDAYFKSIGADQRGMVYPIFKYHKILE